MPTLPSGINFGNFLTPTDSSYEGIIHSMYLKGGFQEVPTLAERNLIPVFPNDTASVYNGFTLSGDGGWTSGRRKVGMLVYVLENQKLYSLIPVGYYGNGGNLGETEWLALSDAQKAVRIFPTGTFTEETANPGNGFTTVNKDAASEGIAADANSCWVELQLGGDNIYTSNLANTIAMVADVGGMAAGTTVADLSNIKTYDQLFDTILFPTSYPTASQPSTSLGDDKANLLVIGRTVNIQLTTGANLGQISLDGSVQGPYAGPVTAASIAGPNSTSYTLGVGPGATDIDDQAVTGHLVFEGNNTWTLTTTFDNGPMPLDSTGANYSAIQYSSGTKTNSTSFEGVYPIQLGTAGGNTSWTERALVSHGGNNITCSQGYDEVPGGVRHRIAIADAMIDNKTVTFQQWNPVATAYADLDASEFTSSAQTFNDVGGVTGNNVAYTVYTKASAPGGGDPGGTPIYRIKFS